ncbi:MAG: hypothetical protein LCH36_00315 [Actinobacteria bacterium]|nr:hypothetical protein [Actinomycetota bacterium]
MRITFEAAHLEASQNDRIISGVLVPYGEQGQTNLGKFEVPRGALTFPSDPSQMVANVEHDRAEAFGHGVRITDSPEGLVFAARAADTPEGDQALADVASGKRTHWSVEAVGLVIEKGKAVAGKVFAAALVEKPAFPSAVLLASAVEDEDGNAEVVTEDTENDTEPSGDATTTTETYTDEIVDEDGNTTLRETTITTVEDGNTTTVTTESVVTVPEEPTEKEEEPIVATLTASARKGATRVAPRARTQDRPAEPPKLDRLFAALSDARVLNTTDANNTLMAALTELKTDGALGHAGGGTPNQGLPDNWVGQLWDGREYDRKFINLNQHGTDITATGKRGYRAMRGTKAAPKQRYDGTWAGELSAIKTANGYIEESGSTLHKWALANTIAREFFDLPGGAEFIEAYFKLLVEDYAMWSDETALKIMLKAAGTPIAPENHLSGYPAQHQYSQAMVMLIQGIRTVNRRGDNATYAVVNKLAYDQLVYTPNDLIPEYITFDITTERGGSADSGKVVVVEADSEDVDLFVDFAGAPVVDDTKPAVLVGAKRAIDIDELGSTPFTVDALEIAKGGIDRALHGYLQEHTVRPRSLALIGTAVAGG